MGYVTPKECAALLGVSTTTLARNAKKYKALKTPGGHHRYDPEVVRKEMMICEDGTPDLVARVNRILAMGHKR